MAWLGVGFGVALCSWKERVFALSKNNKTMYYFDSEASFKKHEENDQLRNFLGTVDLSVRTATRFGLLLAAAR